MTAPDLEAIVDLERQVWEALRRGDPDADRELLAGRFLGVYPSGFGDRAEHVAQLSDGPTVDEYELAEARLLSVTDDHVLLAYRAAYRRPGHDEFESMYVSSLWSHVDGRWVNVFSQDTPAGEPGSVV